MARYHEAQALYDAQQAGRRRTAANRDRALRIIANNARIARGEFTPDEIQRLRRNRTIARIRLANTRQRREMAASNEQRRQFIASRLPISEAQRSRADANRAIALQRLANTRASQLTEAQRSRAAANRAIALQRLANKP